jgi:hypothetical protein
VYFQKLPGSVSSRESVAHRAPRRYFTCKDGQLPPQATALAAAVPRWLHGLSTLRATWHADRRFNNSLFVD